MKTDVEEEDPSSRLSFSFRRPNNGPAEKKLLTLKFLSFAGSNNQNESRSVFSEVVRQAEARRLAAVGAADNLANASEALSMPSLLGGDRYLCLSSRRAIFIVF